jgi:hypothetical protein
MLSSGASNFPMSSIATFSKTGPFKGGSDKHEMGLMDLGTQTLRVTEYRIWLKFSSVSSGMASLFFEGGW